jgi:hypothetical protein
LTWFLKVDVQQMYTTKFTEELMVSSTWLTLVKKSLIISSFVTVHGKKFIEELIVSRTWLTLVKNKIKYF